MLKTTTFILFALALLLAGLGSCNYDNLAELHPEINCDPTSVSFAADIVPIMSGSCNSVSVACHSGGSNSGIDLSTYVGVKEQVDSGKLYSSIIWDGNASQMPSGSSSKIDDCSITKIGQWIADGAPNN
ncbi:MAG: hypothetical protein IT258_20685 [Saprospiraceae bacterium]|nr:hypothetical protein [Saprospiraceae bacterium]